MGLLTGLLTLPFAPVRGAFWALDEVVAEAEAELSDPRRIRAQLADAAEALEHGDIDEPTYDAIEAELLARLR